MTTAVFDMAERPATFDIVPWVSTVGAVAGPGAVDFIVLADRFRNRTEKDRALPPAAKMARVRNIIIPAIDLLPRSRVALVEYPEEAKRWRLRADVLRPSTFVSEVVRQARLGRDVRRLVAPISSPHPGAIVLTIRQSPAVVEKNCHLPDWLAAAELLAELGKQVVLIPDAAQKAGPLPSGFSWCREAAIDLRLRSALYQEAACSLSMGVGPMSVAMHMAGSRYVVFVNHRTAQSETRERFERIWGIGWGEQLPFAGPGQLIDYRRDDPETIVDAFHRTQERAAA